jgi:hypothetical protein
MRTGFRASRLGAAALALASALAVLAACQPAGETPGEAASTPSNADREAEIAAEQLVALGGPASAEVRALYEGEFQASGALDALGSSEGAWELRLLNDYAQLVRPGLGQDGGVPGPRDFRENGMRVTAGPLTITLKAEECALPNGLALPYSAHVLFEGVAYQGCARRGVVEGERPTWASVLPELLPAIDACLARVSARPGRVMIASALDEEMVSVRIREADGDRRECIAAANGSAVSAYESISDLDRRSGEGEPEFVRGGDAPRAEDCRSVQPAANGAGWLINRTC